MHIPAFAITSLPRIVFGPGSFAQVPGLVAAYGQRVLLVTGARSYQRLPGWEAMLDALRGRGMSWQQCHIAGEPSPARVDELVAQYRDAGIEVVLAVGGGSVLDAAKAIAGLLKPGNTVMDHLEGVGPELPYRGPAVPFIAVPTTAGTGSEATRNAVLSVQGEQGFKKSFRDEQLMARYAVVDPTLLVGCSPAMIAANGMDALTQLLESYVSLKANPLIDALALSGLEALRDGLLAWYEHNDDQARARMAYASLLSGITLAQVGLGSVHGLAAPLGAFFPVGHGVVCGTLVAAATQVNIEVMQVRDPENPALARYAQAGRILAHDAQMTDQRALAALVDVLDDWTERMALPRLRELGIGEADFDRIIANCRGSSMKTNPVALSDDEVREVLMRRL